MSKHKRTNRTNRKTTTTKAKAAPKATTKTPPKPKAPTVLHMRAGLDRADVKLPEVPDSWEDYSKNPNNADFKPATQAVADHVKFMVGEENADADRMMIRTEVNLYRNGCNEGETLLQRADLCIPNEAIMLCEFVANGITKFRQEMATPPATPLTPVKRNAPPKAGTRVYVLDIREVHTEEDGFMPGDDVHLERYLSMTKEQIKELGEEFGMMFGRLGIPDVTEEMEAMAE